MSKALHWIIGGAMASGLAATAPVLAQPSVSYQSQVISDGLDEPWSLAFLPDGDMLVTEQAGVMLRISADGTTMAAVSGLPAPYVHSQAGYFDVVLHPDYSSNSLVYLAYSAGTEGANRTTLGRGVLRENSVENFEVLFEMMPSKDTSAHNGGRVVFLDDGTLVMTLGDGFNYREQAQVLSNTIGTFVRLNDDGSIPVDNPFVGVEGVAPEIYSYGHRNPQGLFLDPETGVLYSNEHGPRGGDEINAIGPGLNYGWPFATTGVDYTGQVVTPFESYPNTEDPIHFWTPSIAPSGLTVYRGDMFPEWEGDFLTGALIAGDAPGGIGGHVRRTDMEGIEVIGEEVLFAEFNSRIRDVRVAADGSIYLLTDEDDGQLIRIYR